MKILASNEKYIVEFEKIEQIGNVSLKQITAEQRKDLIFRKRSIEHELYHLFKSNPNYDQDDITITSASRRQKYHLSPVRHNLLKWYPFNSEGEALEIGSDCGALTGFLCNKLKHLIAFENRYQRALVTAHRHSKCSNLEVIVGDFQNYINDRQFDYITLIGVLEHSETLYSGENPFKSLLTRLREMLKPNGELILAIDNKSGLKNIAGAQANHKGQIFNSLNNHFHYNEVKTFSKREIQSLLESSGFSNLDWYYPLPDYKMPELILSNEEKLDIIDLSGKLFPGRTAAIQQKEILYGKHTGKTFAEAALSDEFAKSFLVIARNGERSHKFRCLRFYGANHKRKPEYRTNIRLCVVNDQKLVIKSADNANSIKIIQTIASREAIAQKFFDGKAVVVTGRFNNISLYYPYIEYPSLEKIIANKIQEGDLDFGKSLLNEYLQFLHHLPTENCIPMKFMYKFKIPSQEISRPVECLSFAPIDCVPRNIKVGPEKWYIIDHEWTSDFPLPIDYLLFRGVALLILDLQSLIQTHVSKERPITLFWGYGKNRCYIPLSWLALLQTTSFPLNMMLRWELQFQNKIHNYKGNMRLRLKRNPKTLTQLKIGQILSGNANESGFYFRLRNIAHRIF